MYGKLNEYFIRILPLDIAEIELVSLTNNDPKAKYAKICRKNNAY